MFNAQKWLEEIPTSSSLEQWIEPAVLENYRKGNIKVYRQDAPFPHFLIPKLLKESVFNAVREISFDESKTDMIQHQCEYKYKASVIPGLYRILLGKEWRQFLKALTGNEAQICKAYPYPQLHKFPSGTSGLGHHTDFGSGRDLATLLYLNQRWGDDFGGELGLYWHRGNNFELGTKISPLPNQFVALPISEQSWHKVFPTVGNWERLTLIVDYSWQSSLKF